MSTGEIMVFATPGKEKCKQVPQHYIFLTNVVRREIYTCSNEGGGCSLLTTNRLGLKITQRGQDHEMGMKAWQQFKLKGDQHMSVVMAYQVKVMEMRSF